MPDLDERIEMVSGIFKKYYKDFNKKKTVQEILRSVLNKMGIDESDLGTQILESDTTTPLDFVNAFRVVWSLEGFRVDIPDPVLKYVWKILQSTGKFDVKQIEDFKLLKKYYRGCQPEIIEKLKIRSKDNYVIVFNNDNSVNIKSSCDMLKLAQNQKTQNQYSIEGKLQRVYKVNDFPLDVYYFCPIHQGERLGNFGYCQRCRIKWDVNDYERNVFIALIIKDEDESFNPFVYMHVNLENLQRRYPKTLSLYKKLKEENKLPELKTSDKIKK